MRWLPTNPGHSVFGKGRPFCTKCCPLSGGASSRQNSELASCSPSTRSSHGDRTERDAPRVRWYSVVALEEGDDIMQS